MNELYNKEVLKDRLEHARLAEVIKIKSLFQKDIYRHIKRNVSNQYDDIKSRLKYYDNFSKDSKSDVLLQFEYIDSFATDELIDPITKIKMISVFPSFYKEFNHINFQDYNNYELIKYLTVIATQLKKEDYDLKELFENSYMINFLNDNSYDFETKRRLLNYIVSNSICLDYVKRSPVFKAIVESQVSNVSVDYVKDEKNDYINYINNPKLLDDYYSKNILHEIRQDCPKCGDIWYFKKMRSSEDISNYFDEYRKTLDKSKYITDVKIVLKEIEIYEIRQNKDLSGDDKYDCPKCIYKAKMNKKLGNSKVLNFKR